MSETTKATGTPDPKDDGEGATSSRTLNAAEDGARDLASDGEERTEGGEPEASRVDGGASDERASSPDTSAKEHGEGGEPDEDATSSEVLPRGNPLRKKRGLLAILAGGLPTFLLMAKNAQHGWGIPVGFVGVLVCAFGVLDLCGSFDDDDSEPVTTTTLRELTIPLVRTVALTLAFGLALWAAQSVIGPWWWSSVSVTGTFLGLVASVFDLGRRLGPFRTDELGLERPLFHRHGFWIVAIGSLLYFPAMGLQSLWDPWETHYGEVAREILARDDWISLWWVQDGWFFSKPILNFWIQALSMGSLGTHYQPGQMLFTATGAIGARPEWIVRAPNVLMTIGAMYLLYKGVAKVFGRRAGLLGGLVLATMPDWFFLAHQTMTDMPFVAAMTAAMGLLLFGLNTDEEARVRLYEVRAFGTRFRLSLFHLIFGAVLVAAIPQILYLASRNVELVLWGDGPKGFRLHWDEFMSGSAGNCGQPGNAACANHVAASVPKALRGQPHGLREGLLRYFGAFEPSLQAIVWSVTIGVLLYVNWGERRVRRLIYIAAWLGAAIATMAKGPAGFALPIICAIAYIATKKRWSEFTRLELLSGLLVILAVALPWYVAMYVRHGPPFTDRLIVHDMIKRTLDHVHDTNEGDDTSIRFYIWQLGYALFPWTGLAPLGLLWGFRKSDSALSRTGTSAVGDASVLLVMWFLFAFALFSFMGTKFHHYIFPAVPPVAMLVGIVLDDMLGDEPLAKVGRLPLYLAGIVVGTGLATFGAARFWTGSPWGTDHELAASTSTAVLALVVGIGVVLLTVRAFQAKREEPSSTGSRVHRQEQLMLAGAGVAAALVLVVVGRDLVIKPAGADQPGAIRLLQLFTYNYRRPWPDALDFSAALAGFTAVGVLVSLALGARALRRHATVAFAALAFVWALWGLDVYMVKTSPHWGQRELVETYYRDRKDPSEVLVAYQMNWKGENFYTSNRIPVFVSTGSPFQKWLTEQREKGVKVMYFVTEHTRKNGLRNEVAPKELTELTDKALCNKFILLRADL